MTKKDAAKIGFDPDALAYLGTSSTANGIVSTAYIVIESIQIDDIEDRNIRAAVNNGDLDISLLGMSYLSLFTELSIRGDKMYLTR